MSTAPYDTDFYRWTAETARALREGRLADVDLGHVAEEIEDMGKKERRELLSRMAVLLAHLLKWVRQPGRRSNSWRATAAEQRLELQLLLEDSPSLRREMEGQLARAYGRAVLIAIEDTDLPESAFPTACPFAVDQVLDPSFWPE